MRQFWYVLDRFILMHVWEVLIAYDIYFFSVTKMSVVASAVDTVIVCFAEAPHEFQMNYPQLSEQMVEAWRRTYPQEFVYPRGGSALYGDEADGMYTAPISHAQELQPTGVPAISNSDPLAPPTAFSSI